MNELNWDINKNITKKETIDNTQNITSLLFFFLFWRRRFQKKRLGNLQSVQYEFRYRFNIYPFLEATFS